MGQLILLRHGQSLWNLENRFTGQIDVPLSERGMQEASIAGQLLHRYAIKRIFTSCLMRAVQTAQFIVQSAGLQQVSIVQNKALNERDYGVLQGQNKQEACEKYGEEQVHLWRRGFHARPPGGESLSDTCKRVWPYFLTSIVPHVRHEENVLIVAHGNSLRGLIKYLQNLDDEEIMGVEMATGTYMVCHLDMKKPLSLHILEGGMGEQAYPMERIRKAVYG